MRILVAHGLVPARTTLRKVRDYDDKLIAAMIQGLVDPRVLDALDLD